MIPMMNIVAWGAKAPWPEMRQVEQDLIISRALIDLFADPVLAVELVQQFSGVPRPGPYRLRRGSERRSAQRPM